MSLSNDNMFKTTFKFERSIPRLISSWLLFALVIELINKSSDVLEISTSIKLFTSILIVLGIFILLSVVVLFTYERNLDSIFLFVSHTLFTIISIVLIHYRTNKIEMLYILGFIVLYAFTLLYFYLVHKDWINDIYFSRKLTIILVSVIGFIVFLITSTFMFFKVRTLSSPNFDYGIFNNIMHNIKETGLPLSTCERNILLSHFNVHISPILYVIFPIYLLFPYPETLNIIQQLSITLGVIPILLIAFKRGLSNFHTFLISIIYLLNVVILSSGNYDFHENSLLILPLLFFFFFSLEEGIKRYIGMPISMILVLSIKEDAFIYIFIFSLYLLISEKKYLEGIIYMILPLVYFYFAMKYLNDSGLGDMAGSRYGILIMNKEDGFIGILKTLFITPSYAIKELFSTSSLSQAKLMYILNIFIPLFFIPLLIKKPSRLILLLPLILNLLTEYSYQYNINFQYHYGIMAFIFFLMITNLEDLSLITRSFTLHMALWLAILLFIVEYIPNIGSYAYYYSKNPSYYESRLDALSVIEDDKSVSANSFYIPYLANRSEIYETYYHGEVLDVEYVVLYRYDTKDMNLYYFYRGNGYSIIKDEYDIIILKR